MNFSIICGKCGEETTPYSDVISCFEINFKEAILGFLCPHCGHKNEMNFGDIQKALDHKTRLPSIRGSRI